MEDHCYELNFEAAKIARNVAKSYSDKERFVAGAIGPTNRTGSLSPDVNNPYNIIESGNIAKMDNRNCINGLMDGGADIILIETVFDTLNAKAALFAIDALKEKN